MQDLSSDSDDRRAPDETRRDFIKKAGVGGLSMASVANNRVEDQVAYATGRVNRFSRPTNLEITDMRVCSVLRTPIVRIYTNQGLIGHGDVRDIGDYRYALMLKSRLLGENPCNVERLLRRVKQYGSNGRQGGGVSGVEMALWDLAGKAYGVPVYQMLGGKYRDRVRMYCDTTSSRDPHEFARRLKARVDQGYTALKMDVGIGLIDDVPGALVNTDFWESRPGGLSGWNRIFGSYSNTTHPHTRVQITPAGVERLTEYFAVMREAIGYDYPIGVDHLGHFDVDEAIKLVRAMEPYAMAYAEDLVPWQYTQKWKQIKEASTTPAMTGEDIYGLEGFKDLIDHRAVNVIHPDPVGVGGLLETKRIGDYAEQAGIAMMLHHASSPVSMLAAVHAAAATQNFMWLEHHHVDLEWYEDLVTGIEKPIVQDGFIRVPETPGIGVELNEEAVREHMDSSEPRQGVVHGTGFFEPTPEWNEIRSWDRLWS